MKTYIKESFNNSHFTLSENWLKDIQELHEFDSRIIKVNTLKKDKNVLRMNMEYVDIRFTLFQYVTQPKSIDCAFLNYALAEYMDIYTSFFKFSRKYFKCEKVLYHHDYTIDNVVCTNDGKIKVIDLEDVRYIDENNCYRYYFGKYQEGLSLLSGAIFHAKNGR